MAKYIYAIDERSSFWGSGAGTRPGDNNCMLLKIKKTESMSSIVGRILNYVEPTGIAVLRISGHGYVMDLSGNPVTKGIDGPGLGHGQLGAEGLNVNMVPKFAALKGKFAPGARIELHHCKLADPS